MRNAEIPDEARKSPSARKFGAILAALAGEGKQGYALAELNDLLSDLAPVEFEAVVGEADLLELSPWGENYVAAMVEHAAQRAGVAPPSWTRAVAPLEEPWFASPLARHRPHLLRVSPVPFRRRNLFVDSTVGDRV